MSRIYLLTDLLINTSGAFGASGANEQEIALTDVFALMVVHVLATHLTANPFPKHNLKVFRMISYLPRSR